MNAAVDAAPDMLAALRTIARLLAPNNRTFDDLMRDAMLACDVARAAIAKAEGR